MPARTGARCTSRSATRRLIAQMRQLGLRAGLALNPDTPFEAVAPFLDQVDLVLCMTVFPGFGGQEFMAEVLDKVRQVRQAIDAGFVRGRHRGRRRHRRRHGAQAAAAGANVFVAGSAIFGHERPWEAADRIRRSIEA